MTGHTTSSNFENYYEFTAASYDGAFSVSTCSDYTDYDTYLRLYAQGDCGGTVLHFDDDDYTCSSSSVSSYFEYPMEAGTTYCIGVRGYGSNYGSYGLSVECTNDESRFRTDDDYGLADDDDDDDDDYYTYNSYLNPNLVQRSSGCSMDTVAVDVGYKMRFYSDDSAYLARGVAIKHVPPGFATQHVPSYDHLMTPASPQQHHRRLGSSKEVKEDDTGIYWGSQIMTLLILIIQLIGYYSFACPCLIHDSSRTSKCMKVVYKTLEMCGTFTKVTFCCGGLAFFILGILFWMQVHNGGDYVYLWIVGLLQAWVVNVVRILCLHRIPGTDPCLLTRRSLRSLNTHQVEKFLIDFWPFQSSALKYGDLIAKYTYGFIQFGLWWREREEFLWVVRMKKRQANKESEFLLQYTEAEKSEVDALWKKHSKVPYLFREIEDVPHTSEGTVSIEMTPTSVKGTSMDGFQAKEVEESPGTTL